MIEEEDEKNEISKPIKDWTLGECKEYCNNRDGCSEHCPLKNICYYLSLGDMTFQDLDLKEKTSFSEKEIEKAKAIKLLFPSAFSITPDGKIIFVKDKNANQITILNGLVGNMFPSLRPGEFYVIDEIIQEGEGKNS